METTGIIKAVFEPRTGTSQSGKEWKSRDFVIQTDTDSQYPHHICLSLFGAEKVDTTPLNIGDTIKVFFDIDAREYQGRWYNSIKCWKTEAVAPTVTAQPSIVPPVQPAPAPQAAPLPDADQLPF